MMLRDKSGALLLCLGLALGLIAGMLVARDSDIEGDIFVGSSDLRIEPDYVKKYGKWVPETVNANTYWKSPDEWAMAGNISCYRASMKCFEARATIYDSSGPSLLATLLEYDISRWDTQGVEASFDGGAARVELLIDFERQQVTGRHSEHIASGGLKDIGIASLR